MHSPMEQFEIKRLLNFHIGSLDASFTNSALWMMIAVALATVVFVFGMSRKAMVPGRLQATAELGYEFIAGMVRDNVGNAGKKYFPFIFTLFIFILFCNLLGLVPYAFTPTSHIVVTFAMAATVFIGVTIIGFVRHGAHFLSFFVPKGVPFVLLLLLVPIEVISYFVRPFSLSIRLFANMLAGHTMLKVFGGFVVMLGLYAGWAPLAFIVAFTGLELLIAFLQAYVFAILTCLYLNDAIHLSH
ncbi:MAG: F0F1 ATP synthase subunit A [Proteobacteria bacterium]|nr:F0F1 ATP synthase subunit A [Pseudomonadota bacterium]MBS0546600.1 F0F1 ATP synthase subunit A [Pseudomonadota bacterium]